MHLKRALQIIKLKNLLFKIPAKSFPTQVKGK